MGFFGIGFPELALILAVAVIVLGPERIPGVAIQLARFLRYLRGYATDATAQLRAELGELAREYEGVRRELQEFRRSVAKDLTSVTDELASVGGETDRAMQDFHPIIEPGGDAPPQVRPTPATGASGLDGNPSDESHRVV